MATSHRKVEANRANALKSTGPRTRRGKRAASRNALAHGPTSRAALLPGDDPREYRRFALTLLDELDPHGPLQEELAGEIANLSWKLRRAPGAEAILMEEKHGGDGEEERPPLRVVVNMILDRGMWDHEPRSPLWLLDRYTRNLERSRTSALRMLLSLQKRRREREDADGEETIEPTRTASGVATVARFSPAQNEANGPAGAEAAQPQRPPVDAADGDPPGDESHASGEAKQQGVRDQRSEVGGRG